MKNVIFYIGAGASRGCLPIVSEIPERLKSVVDLFKDTRFKLDDNPFDLAKDKSKSQIQLELISDFEWLLSHCEAHASIDTFAKKLWIRGRSTAEYDRLKLALSIFLIIEQMRNPPDKRYDLFYASILEDSYNRFPENINIVSWNYDYQFELALFEYTDDKRLSSSQSYLGTVSKFGERNSPTPNRFNLYKLNGTTALHDGQGWREYTFIPDINTELDKAAIESFTRSYAAGKYMKGKVYPSLSFAWEQERAEHSVVSQAEECMRKAEILVVIGYSFPFFNRMIDKKLIGAMEKLEKVYIQAPDANEVEERFKASRNNWDGIEIKKVLGVEQFMIPNEL